MHIRLTSHLRTLTFCRTLHSLSSVGEKCSLSGKPTPKLIRKQGGASYENKDEFRDDAYYVENGLRKVYPYYFRHSTFCKGRWVGQNIVDIYVKEFALYSRQEVESRVIAGRLAVNGEAVGPDYCLKNKDLLTSGIHRHELPVLAAPIQVVHDDDDMLVVDKPPSMPVHPCGLYRYNSVYFILAVDMGFTDLCVTHRLDRLTSGVLVFAKNPEKANEIHQEMIMRNIKKEYVCRVEGNFPDGTTLCNKPIRQFYHKVGVSLVDRAGKLCVTEFEKLSFNGKSSVVLCRPHTGRTHQIRVHLQYLGHPIVNDPLYNSLVFGPEKGKGGTLHKSVEDLLRDLCAEHSTNWWLQNSPLKPSGYDIDTEASLKELFGQSNWLGLDGQFSKDRYRRDEGRFEVEEGCYFCRQGYRDPIQTNLFMCLHALSYRGETWEFRTHLPKWAFAGFDLL